MKLDVIFLGGLYQKEKEEEILRNSIYSFQGAANTLQWAILEGLDHNLDYPVNVINSVFIGAWPFRYKKLFIKTSRFNHCESSDDIDVGFVNLYGFVNKFKKISIRPHLINWIKNKSNRKKVIIAYGMNDVFLDLLGLVKRFDSNILTCLIVPDLPEFMNTSLRVGNNRWLNGIMKRSSHDLHFIDKYVLLTEYMAEALNLKDKYIVIEGMIDNNVKIEKTFDKPSSIKIIAYTGVLHARYGILNLLEAFNQINRDDYKLVICGFGDSEDKIKEAKKNNPRIDYKGLISKKEIMKIQQEATVLINPRQNIEEFTKFSFPSKNMEYLASGTPMIAYKLDGVPDEYDEFIYYVPDNTIHALKKKIIEICEKEKDELDRFGHRARKFVENEKNNLVQTKKMIEFIDMK